MQLVQLQANFARVEAAGGAVVAISVDPPDKSREMAALFKLQFPLLQDADFSVITAWGVEKAEIAMPSAFVMDGKRVVIHAFVGDHWVDGVLEAVETVGR